MAGEPAEWPLGALLSELSSLQPAPRRAAEVDVVVFLLPASLLAAVMATHISPVVTPGFAEPQRVLESSASFIILPPVLFASLIALHIECSAEPAVAHFIARGRSRASNQPGAALAPGAA